MIIDNLCESFLVHLFLVILQEETKLCRALKLLNVKCWSKLLEVCNWIIENLTQSYNPKKISFKYMKNPVNESRPCSKWIKEGSNGYNQGINAFVFVTHKSNLYFGIDPKWICLLLYCTTFFTFLMQNIAAVPTVCIVGKLCEAQFLQRDKFSAQK